MRPAASGPQPIVEAARQSSTRRPSFLPSVSLGRHWRSALSTRSAYRRHTAGSRSSSTMSCRTVPQRMTRMSSSRRPDGSCRTPGRRHQLPDQAQDARGGQPACPRRTRRRGPGRGPGVRTGRHEGTPLPVRVDAAERRADALLQLLELPLDDRDDQVFLAGVVAVYRGTAHPGPLRHLRHGHLETLLAEELPGGGDDPLLVTTGVQTPMGSIRVARRRWGHDVSLPARSRRSAAARRRTRW